MNLKDYTDVHTQIALAKAIDAAPSFVNQWVNGSRPVPIAFCVAIERETAGQVTRKNLRPDDWHKYWPELAASPAIPAPAATENVAGGA